MKKILFLINIGILCGWQVTAQTNDYIYINRPERVEKLNTSGKFIGLTLSNTNNHTKSGILYDTLGKKVEI